MTNYLKILIALMLTGCVWAFDAVPAEQDFANHVLCAGAISKVVYASTKSEKETFFWTTVIFVGKEIYDCIKPNPSGFSITDLCADYLGKDLVLVRWEW